MSIEGETTSLISAPVSQNLRETFALLNAVGKAQRLDLAFKRKSNISFQPPGYVIGSEEKVAEEEVFLCDRMINDILNERRKVHPPLQWFSINTAVTSVLQGIKRPVCGLVALCMAGHMLKKKQPNTKLYSDCEILQIAKQKGYTKQGEMFSAKEYAALAEQLYDCKATVLDGSLTNSIATVIEHLSQGLPVIVPYDTDRNYEPFTHKGHKAHWAILTGFVMGIKEDIFKDVPRSKRGSVTTILDLDRMDKSVFRNLALGHLTTYVYAKQGKSARQQLWCLKSLSASNANLKEVNPKRDWNLFRVPEEGIAKTLCSKSVLLHLKAQS